MGVGGGLDELHDALPVPRHLAEAGPGGAGRHVLALAGRAAQTGAGIGHPKRRSEARDQGFGGELGVVAAAVAPAEHPDALVGEVALGGGPEAPVPFRQLPALEARHGSCNR